MENHRAVQHLVDKPSRRSRDSSKVRDPHSTRRHQLASRDGMAALRKAGSVVPPALPQVGCCWLSGLPLLPILEILLTAFTALKQDTPTYAAPPLHSLRNSQETHCNPSEGTQSLRCTPPTYDSQPPCRPPNATILAEENSHTQHKRIHWKPNRNPDLKTLPAGPVERASSRELPRLDV